MAFDTNDDLRAPELNDAVGVLAYKDITQTVTNSTVLVGDESIVWDLVADALYIMKAVIAYLSEDTPDIALGWTIPGDAAMAWSAAGYTTGSVHLNFSNADPTTGATAFGGSGAGAARAAWATGTISTGDEAGEVRLQWAQNIADAANTSVLAGSFGVLRRVF